MALRQTLSTGTSESSIIFFNGGHNHNGTSSALIDTSKYSLYDFTPDFLGTQARQDGPQANNYGKFQQVIARIVKEDVLTIAGIKLLPNEVQAVNISAGAVTANALAANIVLVNNVIRSNNFDGTVLANGTITTSGTTGWAISGQGQAVFDTSFIRGSLTASSVSTPGIDIDSNGNLTANTFALYGNGAIVTSSGNFSVDSGGNLYAENADIAGTINATSGSIAGWSISDDMISAAGGGIYLYQEPGYGSVGAGTGAGQQILMNSEAELFAEFGGVTTQINFQTDSAYVFRITDGSQFIKIAPLLVSAQVGASYSFLANDMIATTGEVSMDTASVNGIGIMYPGCTTGPGAFNYMGLVWDNPNIRGTVDNAVSAVLGTVSDIRSKVNIIDAPSDWALKTLNDLRVVEYNPINILNPDDKTEKPKRLGLIAQELADVFPELVTSVNADDPDAILSVDYLGLVPHLIQVIKLLNDKIESIEQRIGE
jgi:hypothetical protein